jgi:hypothetical protein|tara:strand:+ start:1300 stop:1713 length:414 start_codon:yes stop_codon:yes gene_type:complete
MLHKGRITQEYFNKLYVAYRKNYRVYNDLDLTFRMVMMMHRVNGIEFEERMNEIDINPPAEIEDMFMTPNVMVEEHDKSLDSGREKVIGVNGDDYEYGDLAKAINNYVDDDDIYEDFVDERPEPKRYDDGGDDSNEY